MRSGGVGPIRDLQQTEGFFVKEPNVRLIDTQSVKHGEREKGVRLSFPQYMKI